MKSTRDLKQSSHNPGENLGGLISFMSLHEKICARHAFHFNEKLALIIAECDSSKGGNWKPN